MTELLRRVISYRRPGIVLIHAGIVALAYWLAFLLRFDFDVPELYRNLFFLSLPALLVIRLLVFSWFRLYEDLWRYAGIHDVVAIIKAMVVSALFFLAAQFVVFGHGLPRSVFLLDTMVCLLLVGGVRVSPRLFRETRFAPEIGEGKRALIVGAGDASDELIREIDRSRELVYEIVGIVDDDRRRRGRRIHGVEVVGAIDEIPEICERLAVEEILVALPLASHEVHHRVLNYCRTTGLVFKSVPSLNDLLNGRAGIAQLHEVAPEDLLGREPILLDDDSLRMQIGDRRILVTGAGGSIGSELCRQLARYEPSKLVLFDQAESSLYFVDIELRHDYPDVELVPVVGDITNRATIDDLLRTHEPHIIYHAAAYKHVPLMEAHPLEAIRNNVFGTETVALAAREAGVERFVLISTDKAVHPVGVMGMTKRLAECLVQALSGGPTAFVAVRFGNVLGSEGSVLPLFKRQIKQGGPVTVTDPEATRYFMLISEAAQLVLQAGAMGRGGEIFFLDMGEPVRIYDLAKSLIVQAGLQPGEDIEIEVIGLRPGERLGERLMREREELQPSEHEKVLQVRSPLLALEGFRFELERLRGQVSDGRVDEAVAQLDRASSL